MFKLHYDVITRTKHMLLKRNKLLNQSMNSICRNDFSKKFSVCYHPAQIIKTHVSHVPLKPKQFRAIIKLLKLQFYEITNSSCLGE